MPESRFCGVTVDDIMRKLMQEIIAHGTQIDPSQGACKEITGVLVEITNPRARLSLTETRGRPFSCLGEFCWYMAGSNDLSFIQYYIREYEEYADEGRVIGGYGPRWFDWHGSDQIAGVTKQLREKPHSRQAVIQIFDASDLLQKHKSVPCTCTLQFFIRGGHLQMFTNMRSNDVYKGLPHDIFAFTMLQEIIARDLGVELGTYKHAVGSMHLYDRDRDAADRFLDEGWQSTKVAMPAMPVGDPWPAIQSLRAAEEAIRSGSAVALEEMDEYWADLARLLQVFHYIKVREIAGMQALRESMAWTPYHVYIDKRIAMLQEKSR